MTSATPLLTIPETAARLRMAVGSVYNWVAARRLTVVRIGRHVYVPETEILRLIQSGTVYAVDTLPAKPLAAASRRLRLLKTGGTR